MMSFDLLFELGWKSALLSGAVLALNAALRARPAIERVALLRAATVLLLALPLFVALLPMIAIEAWPAAPAAATGVAMPAIDAPLPSIAPAAPDAAIDTAQLIIGIYALGAALLLLRLATGVALLHRWTARGQAVEDRVWRSALAKLAGPRARRIRLTLAPDIRAPLSWGVRPATILLNPEALARPEQADGVLAHEIAHIRRHDWAFLMLSQLAAALFWFNPLVWLLKRELAHQAEEAADAFALRHVEPAHYAGTLLAFLPGSRLHPATTGMAVVRGTLARRIASILGERPQASANKIVAIGVTACCFGFAAPLSALEFVETQRPDIEGAPALVAANVAAKPQRAGEASPPVLALQFNGTAGRATGAGIAAVTEDGEAITMQLPATPVAAQTAVTQPIQLAAAQTAVQPATTPHAAPAPAPMPTPANDAYAKALAGIDEMMRGADEMENGAAEMERAAAEAPMPEKQREKLLRKAQKLREKAAEMREKASDMRPPVDRRATGGDAAR